MLIFQPAINFCSDENIQTIFGTKLEHFLNYRIDYNSISQTVEKVAKKILLSAPKASKSGDRQVLVEPTMALLWRPLDVLLFRRPKKYFFYNHQKNVTFMHRYQVAKYVIFDSEKIFVKKFPWMLK
jgi:hypothetical protein